MKQAWLRLKACGTQATTLHLQHQLSVVYVLLPPVVVSIELELHFTGRFYCNTPSSAKVMSHLITFCVPCKSTAVCCSCMYPSLFIPSYFPLTPLLPHAFPTCYTSSPPLSLRTQILVRWTMFANRFQCSHKREQMCTLWRKGISLL